MFCRSRKATGSGAREDDKVGLGDNLGFRGSLSDIDDDEEEKEIRSQRQMQGRPRILRSATRVAWPLRCR
jgi:hypothetical protein